MSLKISGQKMFVLPAALAASHVALEHALTKVRPEAPFDSVWDQSLWAARNEYASFQVVVNGGATVANLLVVPEAPGVQALVHCVRYINITTPSDCMGAVGRWPDPLVPARDPFVNQTRRCFPAEVPAGENRAFFVDLWVPKTAAPGASSVDVAVHLAGGGWRRRR